jgi:hypothetical protein
MYDDDGRHKVASRVRAVYHQALYALLGNSHLFYVKAIPSYAA